MKWIEIKVAFDHPEPDLAVDLISGLFFDFDLQGVVVEDPDAETDEDWAEDAVARPAGHAVIGYFAADGHVDEKCKQLEDRLSGYVETQNLLFRTSYRELDDEDWAESWKAFFWPQKVSRKFVVKPTWRDYKPDPDDIVLELDPGMAFGTGTHPTTALCIQMIETHLNKGGSFLDIGTGSGILMIAAAKLGAVRLHGIDRDEIAVTVAQENLKINRIPSGQYSLRQGNLSEAVKQKFDFVVANILTQVIMALLPDIPRILADRGIFVCSGIIAADKNLVIEKLQEIGLEVFEVKQKEEWIAIAAKHTV